MQPISILGVVLAVVSFAMCLMARRHLGKSFSVMPQARALVTTGVYSRIRHPMYVFLDLGILGTALATGSWYPLVLLAILVPLQIINGQRENRVLSEKFGAAYTQYKRGTWF